MCAIVRQERPAARTQRRREAAPDPNAPQANDNAPPSSSDGAGSQ